MGSRSKKKVGSRATTPGRQFDHKRPITGGLMARGGRNGRAAIGAKQLAEIAAARAATKEKEPTANQRKRRRARDARALERLRALDLLGPPKSRRQRLKARKADQRARKAAARAAGAAK